jgi:hypothetical protein
MVLAIYELRRPSGHEFEVWWRHTRHRIRSIGYDTASRGGDKFRFSGATKFSEPADTTTTLFEAIRSQSGGRVDGIE